MNKFFKFLFAAVAIFSLASCLKDKPYEDGITGHDLSNIPRTVDLGFLGDPTTERGNALDFVDKQVESILFYVRLSNGVPSTEDVTVTLDTTGGAARVRAEGATPLPASFFTYNQPSFKVTIPAGQSAVPVSIKVNAIGFDPATTYGLYFKIVSVDKPGISISKNFDEFFTFFSAKNQYDGVYSVISGNVTRYTAPGVVENPSTLNGSLAGNPDVTLTTVSANAVIVTGLQWRNGSGSGVGGIDGLRITVDPVTNAVTMSSSGNATLTNWAGKVNSYDPATRTFRLAFRWNPATTTREYEIVIRYDHPR